MSTETVPHHDTTTTTSPTTDPSYEMYRAFLPPLARGQRTLDRSVFKKTMPMTVANILKPKITSEIRKNCRTDWFNAPFTLRLPILKNEQGRLKGYFLKPDVKRDDLSAASEALRGYVAEGAISLEDYVWEMGYEVWGYDELITAIIPEELHSDIPTSYTQTGHIAHLNLRNAYLPYKSIIGSLVLDKTNVARTVVNKIDSVGVASKFRTFPMEVLAGDSDTEVVVHELDCTYRFDFKDVYWNSRLEGEHRRIVDKCKQGEAVCDAMAGVGPFSIPLGKKRVITWANDLNPESYKSLLGNIKENKVTPFVFASNDDAALHIRQSIRKLYKLAHSPSKTIPIPLTNKQTKQLDRLKSSNPALKIHYDIPTLTVPETFSHFIMNLPDSAITFLNAFIGAYHGLEHLFTPTTQTEMPWIHVYCFQNPVDDETDLKDIADRISKYLQFELPKEDIELHYVRRVAPLKVMYCASFRLPKEVAFADPESVINESEFTEEEKKELERLVRWEIIQ